ncbi:unnamed protein product [Jaminaea pallidilutea]
MRTEGACESLSFVPSAHLPPLRPWPGLERIDHGLRCIAEALGLNKENVVVLAIQTGKESQQSRDDADASGNGERVAGLSSVDETFESRFAQTWLTNTLSSPNLCDDSDENARIQDKAAELLAALCGRPTSSASSVTAFVFRTARDLSITTAAAAAAAALTVRIRDSPMTADALGNRTWGAAPILAKRLVTDLLANDRRHQGQQRPLRCLELGAGTGLVGLAVAACLSADRGDKVDLSDHHPHVLANLQSNVALNEQASSPVQVAHLDWQAVHEHVTASASEESARYSSTAQTLPDVGGSNRDSEAKQTWPAIILDAKYDVLIAADCVYDPHHPTWIRSVALEHLSQEHAGKAPEDERSIEGTLFLISPLRATHRAEMEAIYQAFPLCPSSQGESIDPPTGSKLELCITRQYEETGYDDFGPRTLRLGASASAGLEEAEGGSDEEGRDSRKGLRTVYRTFEIRWCRYAG